MTVQGEARPTREQLAELIGARDREGLLAGLARLAPLDSVRLLSQLRDEDRAALLALLDPPEAAEIIEHIPDVQATVALERIAPQTAARILEELASNQQADLIGELAPAEAEAILAEMEPGEAEELRALASHPPGTAGSLMITEYVALRVDQSVEEALRHLREHAEDYASYDVQYLYVVDAQERLVGVLRFRDILLAARGAPLARAMIRNPLSVRVDARLAELLHFFEEHRFFGVPVVDRQGVLLGVLRRYSVEAARGEQKDRDLRASLGIVGGEELRSMPTLLRSGRRLSWLSVNIVLNVLAASVIALHQDTLQAVIALAVFLPIISDMSGCSGNQAVAVSLRELTLGVVRPLDVAGVVGKEALVGLLNGLALGLAIGLVAWVWKGNAWLALVVGLALAVNTLVAVCVGGAVPLVLKALRRDPALASGPILTTVTDMCGFFAMLSLASLLIERLA